MKRSAIALVFASGCLAGEEPAEVEIPVVTANGLEATTTDLGYEVEVTRLRAALRGLELTVEGEEHASLGARLWDWAVPSAHAHPGHLAGGTVTGEMPGDFLVSWSEDGAPIGDALALVGSYQGANFSFRRAGEGDALEAGDPLLGHTFHVEGVATDSEGPIEFELILDLDEDARIVGVPFDYDVTEADVPTIGLEMRTVDPYEGDVLFDGIDFAALDEGGDGSVRVEPGTTAHNRIRRAFQVHDYYFISIR